MDNPQSDLTAALVRAAGGDRDAFRFVYDNTAPKLLGVIRRILKANAAAEDALQEAYVRVWSRAKDFDASIASPIAWMTTIARHVAIDAVRRGAERVSAASEAFDADMAERMPATSAETDPMAAARLARCLEALEADRRGMVVLAYCHGWSREELAERFARPVATIKTVLRRSLMHLKDCLGGG